MVGEKVIWEGKPELVAYWLPIGVVGVMCLPILASGALPALIIPLGVIAYIWLSRLQYNFRVTNARIICRKGILSTRTSEIDIVDIRSINVNQGFVQRLLGIGSLEFSTASGPLKEAILLNVRNPEGLKELIRSSK